MTSTKNKSLLATLTLLALAIVGCGHSQAEKETSSANKKTCASSTPGCIDGRLLHVPSPEWQDQIIYFLMIDRFNDGDPSLNDQGYGLYDPTKESLYSGGDLQGIIDKLDYIQNLGATALWITPPIASQWWNDVQNYGGYHGYWARDHSKIDEHFGNKDTYKDLSHNLHMRGMYLLQDIVVNHVGNYFDYETDHDPNDPTVGFEFVGKSVPTSAPTLAPFDMNDANNPEHVNAGIYHWNPLVSDYSDQAQVWTYQPGRLDDLNTSNTKVRTAFKNIYGAWIRDVGVDAFRIDTIKYVEHDFWHDFLHGEDGILNTAAETGRENFFGFGEVKEVSPPYSVKAEKKLVSYLGTAEKPEIASAIGFPLYEELGRVFATGRPTSLLSFRLNAHLELYPNPYIVPNFVDNHETPRFPGSVEGLKQALAVIFTIPGIPIIYQGTEQNHFNARQSMFAGGYLAETDQFNEQSELFVFIQALSKLRTENSVFTRGAMEVLADNPTNAGIIAYKRSLGDEHVFIIMNTAEHTSLLNNMPTGLSSGRTLTPLFGVNIDMNDVVVGSKSNLTLKVPPRGIMVLKASSLADKDVQLAIEHGITVDQNVHHSTLTKSTALSGTISKPNTFLALVIDGNLDAAEHISADAQGRWQTTLPIVDLGEIQHSFELYSSSLNAASPPQQYIAKVDNANWERTFNDALDDDHGLSGSYIKPTDPSFGKQMDMESVKVRSAGKVLQLDITMHELTDIWVSSNKFDHVAFNIFFDFPANDGLQVLPKLNAKAPDGFLWDVSHTIFGWGNFLSSTEGAEADKFGLKIGASPSVSVDKAHRTITLTYNASVIKQHAWEGARIYLTTWDRSGEGSVRRLTPEGDEWTFGGGNPDESLIMDDLFIALPE